MKDTSHLIIGAAGGIGRVLAARLSARGARLMLAGRDEARLGALAKELGAAYRVLDATSFAAVEECVAFAAEAHDGLDGLANLAGSLILKPAHLTSEEELQTTLDTNLKTAFAAVRAAASAMRRIGGSVVLVSSAAARVGLANHEAIAAAKAGIEGLTLSAAATYASRGIRVNAVAPGLTRTPLTAKLTGNEAAAKGSEAMHALGRLGEPADVASAIEWLLDPGNSWVTGQVLGVDGGLARVRPRK